MIDSRTAREIARSYFGGLGRLRKSGSATGERSTYPVLGEMLNAIGSLLNPKVTCVSEPTAQGAGHPDFGLFSERQIRAGKPGESQAPEFGVVEVKPVREDAWLTAEGAQVTQYWRKHRLVLVTNLRDFVLVGENERGQWAKVHTLRLAGSAEEFQRLAENPGSFAKSHGARLVEFLVRTLSHRATIADPRDLAVLFASHARDALARVEEAGDVRSLKELRTALEKALGIHFKGEKGGRFFRSALVQTLFYGLFSAWVLWARPRRTGTTDGPLFEDKPDRSGFSWHREVRSLQVPVLRALFWQISDPEHLESLNIEEALDHAAAVLSRVDRASFFGRLKEGEAVPYFYEPFLRAFDPEMRKQLGVWYTPPEVVKYMVARVDRVLREDLGIAKGLLADNVYVLDPCCGTGAYLTEVLRRIAHGTGQQGHGALAGEEIRKAATSRLFGFEIMPAPYVVAHLQVGLTLEDLNAPLGDGKSDCPQIFLTNALTGWQPKPDSKPLHIQGLEEERVRSRKAKQETPVLVILGNPPYAGLAEAAEDEERRLTEAYRATRRVARPQGKGVNDPYVRFFRMAERHITEKMGEGIVCFISNHSWLDGLSFTGMRERYLEEFDAIRIDCLNGDRYATGKTAPDGSPDPSIFSTEGDPVGIQVGTAIATLVRKKRHVPTRSVEVRQLWGAGKRAELERTAETPNRGLYARHRPALSLGLPFLEAKASRRWHSWPALPELFPCKFPGIKTGLDAFLVDIDLRRLKERIGDYFNPGLSHEEIASRHPEAMGAKAHFDARAVREKLLRRGGPAKEGFVRYAYLPFDVRWLYWDGDLLGRPRPSYAMNVFEGNRWLVSQQRPRREWSPAQVITPLGCVDLIFGSASIFPLWLNGDGVRDEDAVGSRRRPNLSRRASQYIRDAGASEEDLFHCVLGHLHDPGYRRGNAGALRMGWPRIPLPDWPRGSADGVGEKLARSAAHGRRLARLLDVCVPVPGVTVGELRPELALVAVPAVRGGGNMARDDFILSPKWGKAVGAKRTVMPGPGAAQTRTPEADERSALGAFRALLGKSTVDVHLNGRAYWRNIPSNVWEYRIGGYQVLKKWLSYRAHPALGRAMGKEEVEEFSGIARRIAAVLVLTRSGTP